MWSFVERVPVCALRMLTRMSPRPLVLGHRGASRAAPENTLAAFALAREQGADGVELDARRTADGVLVVHHDPSVEGFGLLAQRSWTELHAARPDVATLRDALDACRGLLVNVEIKCLPWEPDADPPGREVVHRVADEVRAEAPDAIVSSFDLGAIDACRAYAPELTTGLLTSGQELHVAGATAAERGHQWLNPDRVMALRASAGVVAELHDRGLRVSVWTVDDPDELRHLANIGVDAVITNVPDVALRVLG